MDWPAPMRFGYDTTYARTVINGWAYADYEAVARIADELGYTDDWADYLIRVHNLKSAMNSQLINSSGVYVDGLNSGGSWSSHVSQHANMLPPRPGLRARREQGPRTSSPPSWYPKGDEADPTVFLDGVPVAGVDEGNYIRIAGAGSGAHTVIVGSCDVPPPVGNSQSVTTCPDTAVPITLVVSDPSGELLTYAVVTGPADGSLPGTAPNLTFTPGAGFSGEDAFTYSLSKPPAAPPWLQLRSWLRTRPLR